MHNKDYLVNMRNKDDFKLISQKGLKQIRFPNETLHNASWDSVLTPDGKLFLSLCSELTTSEFAKLAEYDISKDEITEHFYTKNYLPGYDRYIRDSKFHTSMGLLRDGSLIMATHTTDKAPDHPAWMPHAFFSNPWEGYPGSTLFRYDPEHKMVENLGIPAPRESIYGAAYDSKNNNYYMLGFMKGHLYKYSLDTKQVVDMGKVAERASYKMVVGSDDNIYFTTRNGILLRINVDKEEIESLGYQLPNSSKELKLPRSYMSAAANGPDGKLYIGGQFHNELSVYDPKTNSFNVIGKYILSKGYISDVSNNPYIGGMAFDSKGILWYIVCGLRHDKGEDFRPPSALMRWDVLNGKDPEYLGLMGTKERVVTTTAGVFIDKDKDLLYVVGTNHADEGPDINVININEFETEMYNKGPISADPFIHLDNGMYKEYAQSIKRTWETVDKNPVSIKASKIIPVPLWSNLPYNQVENSAIQTLLWKGNILYGICGKENRYSFSIGENGELLSFKKLEQESEEIRRLLLDNIDSRSKPDIELNEINLPSYPGRQYKAKIDKFINISNNRILIATFDGMLAIVDKDTVYSLGPACTHGKVNDMTSSNDGEKVYGVAGDKDDLGNVFSYSDKEGLRWLGQIATDGYEYGNHASFYLGNCSLDDNGETLAIGSADRMGTVYLVNV